MITLEPILHRECLCLAIRGKLSGPAYEIVQRFPGRKYSRTLHCFYVPYTEENLKQLNRTLEKYEKVNILPLPPSFQKKMTVEISTVNIPDAYTAMLMRKRYSEATCDNYVIQFRKFLEHISPKTVDDIDEPPDLSGAKFLNN